MLAILISAISTPFMWDKLLPVLINSITGNPVLSGVIMMLIVFLLGQVLRFPMEIQIMSMFFGIFFIFSAFIPWLVPTIWLLLGLGVAIYVIYYLLSR
jgi:hypothetical protein